ncbi:MAG: ATP-grasp domain-containing protein [Proteobacteria bacterium]|nr:ATP-grasp domain-containing protein [Pseudomonadota bacterium]
MIVARTARPLVEMAREAGYVPHAIDLFGDDDTRAAACSTTVLEPDRHFDFDGRQLLGAVAAYQALQGPLPVVCGSAFERAPGVLAKLARHVTVLGCDDYAYRRLLNPPALFASLRRAGIATPATRWQAPRCVQGWLSKQAGGSGGAHVSELEADGKRGIASYYQRHVEGASRSALFIGNGREARLQGCAEHLRWHRQSRFRYEGARRLDEVPGELRRQLDHIGAVLAATLRLRGCFGIDFLWREGHAPLLVDINPRPTATLELWPERQRMFSAHLAACTDQTLLYSSREDSCQRAHLVLYAECDWRVPRAVAWPEWIADRPPAGSLIMQGAPLCTVRAEAATHAALAQLLRKRYADLRELLDSPARAPLPASIDIRNM